MKNKIVIIGCGNVGMSYAYALLNQKINVHELILIDINKDRILGEAMDLNHCLAFAPNKIKIKAGDYKDCKDATIVCIAAGANQKPGETRMDLIYKNSKIFKEIVDNVMNNGFNGIFLVATNPLDIMTYQTYKYSKLPSSRVIGSGTTLDTARLRYIIADKFNYNPKNIHAYVIGEHGDSEFVPWSSAEIGLRNITDFVTDEELKRIYIEVRDSAYDIINKKGATYYGIGMCLVYITNAILNDLNSIITISCYDEIHDIYISYPAIINRSGVREILKMELTNDEKDKLNNSIHAIQSAIQSLEE